MATFAACVWIPSAAWAKQAAVPALTGPLMDLAQVARGPKGAALRAELEGVHADTGVQLVVLTLPTLGGAEVAPFAHRVMETWRLGAKGSDLGLLLLVVPEDRTTRLEVGYGLEGVLPDALAKQVLADVLAPQQPGEALSGQNLLATVQLLHQLLREARDKNLLPAVAPGAAAAPEVADVPLWAFVCGVLLVLVLARYLIALMPRNAPEQAPMPMASDGLVRGRRGPDLGGRPLWHLVVQLLLALLGGGRGGPPSGGGYSGGGGRSGGGGASNKY